MRKSQRILHFKEVCNIIACRRTVFRPFFASQWKTAIQNTIHISGFLCCAIDGCNDCVHLIDIFFGRCLKKRRNFFTNLFKIYEGLCQYTSLRVPSGTFGRWIVGCIEERVAETLCSMMEFSSRFSITCSFDIVVHIRPRDSRYQRRRPDKPAEASSATSKCSHLFWLKSISERLFTKTYR